MVIEKVGRRRTVLNMESTVGFHEVLGNSSLAQRLAASQEVLSYVGVTQLVMYASFIPVQLWMSLSNEQNVPFFISMISVP
jgi:hypothetical protein